MSLLRLRSALDSLSPSTNRGVEPSHNSDSDQNAVYFGIDWLSVTLWRPAPDELARFLAFFDVDYSTLDNLNHGTKGFKSVHEGARGFRLHSSPDLDYLQCVFPGDCVGGLDIARIQAAFEWLFDRGFVFGRPDDESALRRVNVTRLDLAFDHQIFKPWDFTSALESDKATTRAHRSSFKLVSDLWRDSYTQYVGSRESERFLRVYHKRFDASESADSGDSGAFFNFEYFTRLELEIKGDSAVAALLDLLAAGVQHWPARALGMVLGFIDVDTDWWRDFVSAASGRIRLAIRRAALQVERAAAWLESQVSGVLAMVYETLGGAAGPDYLLGLVAAGRERWSSRHRRAIDEWISIPF